MRLARQRPEEAGKQQNETFNVNTGISDSPRGALVLYISARMPLVVG